jgi:pyruvate/2-oxoglutarate dehydrogenase complex dihydrolipoamide acyltransferase (E2) component
MISRHLYPTKPWPLAKLGQHPCMRQLVADSNNHDVKGAKLAHVRAVIAVIRHVGTHPAAYANPTPVARALDAIRDMPRGYDEGALLDELVRLKIFVIEHRDFDAWMVPAESATATAEPAKAPSKENVTVTVAADAVARVRDAARRRGVSVSALLAPVVTEFAATL